ncbi:MULTISPECIES: DUF2782 domain-containing protein [unclassified Marinobacter]|uniref:DUF2782 domain-containing protein n=1 Tax=unclassified Marinobacter TaxID=83889 RepID=UPI0026E44DB4|nr:MULTISPECIES: DUF2782 domain-containing protein [unclassified Marinobacter]MDO6444050.1 DUF2782 domain-containing protein [Marinobacter sp. 2_MG-2023]MDO6824039.1 DUF2782 domain-containing protein [Marinobacter sp. 1_MG-2023]
MKRIVCSAFLLVCGLGSALAQESGALDEAVVETPKEPVVISDYQSSSEGPQIVIRPGDEEIFYEYRVNGQLMEIKVVPEVGVEYYLVPVEGGGWIRETDSDMLVPSWILFRW